MLLLSISEWNEHTKAIFMEFFNAKNFISDRKKPAWMQQDSFICILM